MNRQPVAPYVSASREDGVLCLTLNRAEARNPLSQAMMSELQLKLDEAAEDRASRVIVIAATGPVFSAGHDLKELTTHRAEGDRGLMRYRQIFAQCSRLMQTIMRHPKPVIAQVQGMATAAGCQLVASCDLAIASSEARFATPGVNIGLFCSTPMVALSRAVARKNAMEMLLTGRPIGADEAERIGLINRAVPADEVARETRALADLLAAKPAATLKMGKMAFQQQLELGVSAAYDYVGEIMVQNMLHAEAEEGICAFIEKRAPNWQKC